ncbi:hypothetical protein GCM10022254_23650 [Actinomadura meridiana]|uniref:Uncharacterized protein n=1 Tax=Actinomadura meridiana TaxID=559626 RepID=A0ABP8BYC4_9ACTN
MLASSINPSACAHRLPGSVASLIPDHDAARWGDAQRSDPVGGAAYGIPWNSRAFAVSVPRTAPASVETTVEESWLVPACSADAEAAVTADAEEPKSTAATSRVRR